MNNTLPFQNIHTTKHSQPTSSMTCVERSRVDEGNVRKHLHTAQRHHHPNQSKRTGNTPCPHEEGPGEPYRANRPRGPHLGRGGGRRTHSGGEEWLLARWPAHCLGRKCATQDPSAAFANTTCHSQTAPLHPLSGTRGKPRRRKRAAAQAQHDSNQTNTTL